MKFIYYETFGYFGIVRSDGVTLGTLELYPSGWVYVQREEDDAIDATTLYTIYLKMIELEGKNDLR